MDTGQPDRFSDRAAQAAHETIEKLHERASHLEDQVRETAGQAASQAMAGGQRVEGAVDALVGWIRQNPLTATAIGVAVGFALASVLRHGTGASPPPPGASAADPTRAPGA